MSYADPQDSSRRLTGLAFVVALHVLLVYALINGLAKKIIEVVQAPLETKIIEEVKKPPPDKPPPPPPKRFDPAAPCLPDPLPPPAPTHVTNTRFNPAGFVHVPDAVNGVKITDS